MSENDHNLLLMNTLYQELSFLRMVRNSSPLLLENTLFMTFEQILVINNLNELIGCHSNSS